MEAPIQRILVLAAAVLAEPEAGHRRVRPVVGHRADDREARAALGAVHERVAVAPVGRVEQLAHALVAGGDVRRDQCRAARGPARDDAEGALATRRQRLRDDRLDSCERRRLRPQTLGERLERALLALDLGHDAVAVVQDEAAEPAPRGEPVDERPEADALDDA